MLFFVTIHCTGQGRKRALLIGINYFGSANALNGCINDVKNVKEFLITLHNFRAVSKRMDSPQTLPDLFYRKTWSF